jgi:hypothetical protein
MSYVVLFYTKFFDTYPTYTRFESVPEVEFTTDRSRLRQADAVVLHLPNAAQVLDAVKYPGQVWISWSMESDTRTRLLGRKGVKKVFDLHIGFHRRSDIWSPYVPLLAEWHEALAAQREEATEAAPAVLFQSAKTDQWGRDAYLTEVMEHMPFDSYGRFLKNKELPVPDRGADSKLQLLSRYKFTFGFENTIEDDYVTEKFFQPLLAGSVPVYLGAPNVADFAPGEHCFIDASRFSPRELAAHLKELAADQTEYARYHAWRTQPLRPEFVRLVEPIQDDAFLRLARLLKTRLDARGARDGGRAVRPFGWHGLLDARWRPIHAALRRARKRLGLSRR